MTTATPLRPPSVDIDGLPRLIPLKYGKTEDQVFTHRSYFARPTAVFEDPPNDLAPDNEVLEYIGDSVLSLAVVTLAKTLYPGLRVGPHAKMRSLVVQNVTIATISEHYGLSRRLRANQSQLPSLQRSVYVQADLFEAYIGGLYNDYSWEYVKPWLHKVLRPYVEEAYRIVQSSYCNARDHDKSPPNLGLRIGNSPRPPLIAAADGPSPGLKPQSSLGIFHSPHLGGPSPIFHKASGPLASTASPGGASPSSLPEGHLSLLNQILQHARKNMDWDFTMDPQSPTTTPVWDAKGKLSNVVIAKGRGNTKKLAKNDGAKDLVLRLQEGLSGSRHAHSIPNLAKELARQQKEMNDWKNEEVQYARRLSTNKAATERRYDELPPDELPPDKLPPDELPPYPLAHRTPTGKGKRVGIWGSEGEQWEDTTAYPHHSVYSTPRDGR